MSESSSSERRIGAALTIVILGTVVIAGLAIGIAPRSAAATTRTASGASGPVIVHVGNASSKGQACQSNNIAHVFVTIADVQAHQSGNGNAGWQDLTPNLSGSSVQIDLVDSQAEANEPASLQGDCVLATLDSGTNGLPSGKYQQLRLSLVGNGESPAPVDNACASLGSAVVNCIEFSDGSFAAITVPSGIIKIPSSRIAHGGLTIVAGTQLDLDIDINACADIVVSGGGARHGHRHRHSPGSPTYALKPVLHAGEMSLNSLLSGDVVFGTQSDGSVASSSTPISGATVFLELQPGSPNYDLGTPGATTTPATVDDLVAQSITNSLGHFVFCPVPNGTYEVVADSNTMPSSANPSDATITTGVVVGDSGGPSNLVIPLLTASAGAVTLDGQFTTQDATSSGISESIMFGGAQGYISVSTTVQAQIPLLSGSDPALQILMTTADSTGSGGPACAGNTCPTNTDCACVALDVPPDNPVIGLVGGPYNAPAASPVYSAFANVPESAHNCTPAKLVTDVVASLSEPTLSFTTCE